MIHMAIPSVSIDLVLLSELDDWKFYYFSMVVVDTSYTMSVLSLLVDYDVTKS